MQRRNSGDEHYLQSACDHLLETTCVTSDSNSEASEHVLDPDGLLGHVEDQDEEAEPLLLPRDASASKRRQRRAFFIRTLALLCACSLSIGSH